MVDGSEQNPQKTSTIKDNVTIVSSSCALNINKEIYSTEIVMLNHNITLD